MILIITMAGNQQLAADSYQLPTYLLPWGERSVFAAVLGELLKGGSIADVALLAAERDEPYAPHLRATMRVLGLDKRSLFFVDQTSGQAETAALGIKLVEQQRGALGAPVLFHNADTILRGRDLAEVARALTGAQGYVDVFRASHHKYSYVLLDAARRVTEIAEKIVISDTATSGLYGFASAAVFRDHFDPKADKHISAIYRRMLARAAPVVAGAIHSEADTIVVGTPDDYMNASILIQ
jgi:hypothetical protein